MSARYAGLVKTLPPRLVRFFERYPPHLYAKNAPGPAVLATSDTSNSSASTVIEEPRPDTLHSVTNLSNPFRRTLHPVTGRWHEPIYSLRTQTDLVKLAREHGVEELLPSTVKGTEEQLTHRIEKGIRMKGTGVGQKVKGHWHERTLRTRLDKRRQAMMNMPKMINEWKQVKALVSTMLVCH